MNGGTQIEKVLFVMSAVFHRYVMSTADDEFTTLLERSTLKWRRTREKHDISALLLQKSEDVYDLCVDMMKELSTWVISHSDKPKWKNKFCSFRFKKAQLEQS